MIRSLYSAVSGMLNNQRAMDVIGNNIANANTVAFKSSRTDFADAFYQVSRSSTINQPVGNQVGLGNVVVSTPSQFTQGAFQRTDVPSDVAINGDGFFCVQNANGTTNAFTRAGDFILNTGDPTATPAILGYLTTQDGWNVMGSAPNPPDYTGATSPAIASGTLPTALDRIYIPMYVDAAETELTSSYSIDSNGMVTAVGQLGTSIEVGMIGVATFPDPNGLIRDGSNRFSYNAAAGPATSVYQPGVGSAGTVQQGALELSNVDLAEQFSNMIITQRAFDANARTISTSDEMLQTVTNLKR